MGGLSLFARSHLAMLAFSFLVAGSFSLGTRVANMMEPEALNALRFMLTGAVVGAVAFTLRGFQRAHIQAPWRYVILGGTFAIYFALMFEGLKTAAPVSAAAVFTLTPLMAAVFGLIMIGQKLSRWMVIALLIGAVGAIWVIFRGDITAMIRFEIGRGEAIYFVGCIAHAIYIPLVRKLNRGEPALIYTFWMVIAAVIGLTTLGAPDLARTDWSTLPPLFWATLLYLAIGASAMTFVLLQFASLNLPAANVMAYTYLTPIWVIGWELVLTGTLVPLIILPGVFAAILSLLMLLRAPR